MFITFYVFLLDLISQENSPYEMELCFSEPSSDFLVLGRKTLNGKYNSLSCLWEKSDFHSIGGHTFLYIFFNLKAPKSRRKTCHVCVYACVCVHMQHIHTKKP